MNTVIRVQDLCKTFQVRQTLPHLRGTFQGLFRRQTLNIPAIENLHFEIEAGQRVAFIGPNGAGKSTTIKMLTGILHPSSGVITVLGLVPSEQRQTLGFRIGTVFGQRTQLWYHLPPKDTFALLASIYELKPLDYQKRLDHLIELFDIGPLLHKPVRQLSLGERMRCEIVASLLHQPEILFLDEPTIGLDINAKLTIRTLLTKLCQDYGTTLFLTSHDTADIEQVCNRVLVLDKGHIVLDSSVKELKKTYIKKKIITLTTDEEHCTLTLPGLQMLEQAPYHVKYELDLERSSIEQFIQEALRCATVKDLTLEDPSMEEIIQTVYQRMGHPTQSTGHHA